MLRGHAALPSRPLTRAPRHAQPLYNDYRRVRRRATDGRFQLQHVDQFIDELLTQARAFAPHASTAT